jgi:TolB-like protein/class 3 adenylate cyclase
MASTRRLAAILAADVAGYSRLMGADEEGTHERLRAHLRELVDPKIAEHRGRIVKNTGDGILAEFPSVVDAVRCAVEIQRGMIDRELDVPEERRIKFRIGVNLGDVIVEDDDIFGDGVNVAARLEALAEPGGICVAHTVRSQIRDKLPYAFEDMGEQSVKNIARPVRADAMSVAAVAATPLIAPAQSSLPRHRLSLQLAVAAAGIAVVIAIGAAGWWAWPNRNPPTVATQTSAATGSEPTPAIASTTAPRLSIVVLPFINLSNEPGQEYFADSVTDDLTTDLSRIADSFVIARTTAFTYKGRSVDVKQIGRELGVRYVMEGSVRRAGDKVQVNAQLIDAENGAHLWADRFDTDRASLAEAQSEITGRLALALGGELLRDANRRIEHEGVADPDARDLIMRGRALQFRPNSAANRQQTQRFFERALETDPRSVLAKLLVAGNLVWTVGDGWSNSVEQDKLRAERLLAEVFEREPNSSLLHQVLGALRRLQNRLTEARIEYEVAVALNPNNVTALRNLGLTLMGLGQPEAAIPYIEKALLLDPRGVNFNITYLNLGRCHLLLGHVNEAIELLSKSRAANPRYWVTHLWLAGAFGLRGDLDEARAALAEGIRLKPEINSMARWGAYGMINAQYSAFRAKTVDIGLRRAGMPEE